MRVPDIDRRPQPGATCPVCRGAGRRSARYPAALCPACVARLVDGKGRAVTLSNTGPLGHGLQVVAGADMREEGDAAALPLFCDGVECRAREARFGGVVVQPLAAWQDG